MKYIALLLLPIILTIAGCNSMPSYRGGRSTFDRITSFYEPDAHGVPQLTKTEEVHITVEQPDASQNSGEIVMAADGSVKTKTGSSQKFDFTAAVSAGFLNPVLYVGLAMIVGSVIVFWLLKDLRFALIVAGTGVGLIALSYFLLQYGWIIFGVALLAALGAAVWLILHWKRERVANVENVGLVSVLRKKIPEKEEKAIFGGDNIKNPDINSIQSKSTKKLVSQIKKTEGI